MKFFVTGGSGILGTDIIKVLSNPLNIIQSYNSTDIDIGDIIDVEQKMQEFSPDIVIHCAAMTNVDLCEDNKSAALRINVEGSKNLAIASAKLNIRIVYISSCGVYGNGNDSPHTELDETAPVNFHHLTKLEGEKAIETNNPHFLIIRTGWLFGGTRQHKKNFVEARRREALTNSSLKSAGDKFGSPTYTADLASQIVFLLDNNVEGTYNVVNLGCASRFDYVQEIVRLFEFETTVEAVGSDMFPRRAVMPDNECLQNYYLDLKGMNKMRPWEDALKDYINTTYFK